MNKGPLPIVHESPEKIARWCESAADFMTTDNRTVAARMLKRAADLIRNQQKLIEQFAKQTPK